MENILKAVRTAIHDCDEPYTFSDEYLKDAVELAVIDYSKYNPVKKIGEIMLSGGKQKYPLPSDFMLWPNIPDGYSIIDDSLYLQFIPAVDCNISFIYYARRTADRIPAYDISLIADHCFYTVISGLIKEQTEISSIKLGQGLQIQFSGVAELEKLAVTKLNNFNDKLARAFGGWA